MSIYKIVGLARGVLISPADQFTTILSSEELTMYCQSRFSDQSVSPTDLAWAAGLVDGEGCISIDRQRADRKRGEVRSKHRLKLRVQMTHPATINRLADLFRRGSILSPRRTYELCADKVCWSVSGSAAYYCLTLIRPYLFTKRAEAEVAIEFFEWNREVSVPGRNGTSPEVVAKRDDYYWRIRDLKTCYKTFESKLADNPIRRPRRLTQLTPGVDEETLRRLYHVEGKSLADLGEMYGRTKKSASNWLKRFGISARPFCRKPAAGFSVPILQLALMLDPE
jgi:hypothetical protein